MMLKLDERKLYMNLVNISENLLIAFLDHFGTLSAFEANIIESTTQIYALDIERIMLKIQLWYGWSAGLSFNICLAKD